jgi:exopolysaccharide production protein ExoQ
VQGFGRPVVIAEAALCVLLILWGARGLPAFLLRRRFLVALPIFFALSCMWSDERVISLSLGMQTLLSVTAAVAVAHRTSPRQFLLVVFISASAICLISILYGRTGAAASGAVLIGVTGSKDAMGLLAQSLVVAAVAILFDRRQRIGVRAGALSMMFVGGFIIAHVQAATAVVGAIAGVFGFMAVLVVGRIGPQRRIAVIVLISASLISFATLLAPALLDVAREMVFRGLHKDITLTGRTILWSKAVKLIEDAPVLGHGYRAYWLGSSSDVRWMLVAQGQTDGHGFHFHDQYLETLVDTGLIGEGILLTTLALIVRETSRRAIRQPSAMTAYAFATVMVLLMRSPFETDFLPFGADMMVLFGLGTIAFKKSSEPESSRGPLVSRIPASKNPVFVGA